MLCGKTQRLKYGIQKINVALWIDPNSHFYAVNSNFPVIVYKKGPPIIEMNDVMWYNSTFKPDEALFIVRWKQVIGRTANTWKI